MRPTLCLICAWACKNNKDDKICSHTFFLLRKRAAKVICRRFLFSYFLFSLHPCSGGRGCSENDTYPSNEVRDPWNWITVLETADNDAYHRTRSCKRIRVGVMVILNCKRGDWDTRNECCPVDFVDSDTHKFQHISDEQEPDGQTDELGHQTLTHDNLTIEEDIRTLYEPTKDIEAGFHARLGSNSWKHQYNRKKSPRIPSNIHKRKCES